MAATIQLTPKANLSTDACVQIEIVDQDLKLVAREWIPVNQTRAYEVPPGLVGVRASFVSGIVIDQSVRVEPGETKTLDLNLYKVCPQESQQWAYLTQSISAAGKHLLSNPVFEGLWIRLWRRMGGGAAAKWEVVPLPITDKSQATWSEEGVTYSFSAPSRGLYAVQVGGPKVPWKIAAVPSTQQVMVLVRPAPEHTASIHPLDVVVSSDNTMMESLLTLMQRGDIAGAQDLDGNSRFAENLLFGKYVNTDAAAVGGYYLLRIRDLKRLHNWANNLANSFQWMADGPIIHAWQIILGFDEDPGSRQDRLAHARSRLLEAVSRGFPIYTEGLRLLRDGLLFIERSSKTPDPQVTDALNRVSEYTAVLDKTMTTTTFTGKTPEEPKGKAPKGTPRDKGSLIYVYDVPPSEVLRASELAPGDTLLTTAAGQNYEYQITPAGKIKAEDGSTFTSIGAAQQYSTGDSRDSLSSLRSKNVDIDKVIDGLRMQPRKDEPSGGGK